MTLDLITAGRVSMDLFAREIGADFPNIKSFETGVGGSPVNIAIGASRLGLRALAFTAVGDDEVGRFVRHYLRGENVRTDHVLIKAGRRTGMAVVGVQPPDRFPLTFYREDAADPHLTIDDALDLPMSDARFLQLSGTALSRGTMRDATLYLAERARQLGMTSFIDLDLRPDQWSHPLAFGLNMRRILPLCDVIIGTEEEFEEALSPQPERVMAGGKRTDPERLQAFMDAFRAECRATLVVKRGERGVSIMRRDGALDLPGFPVKAVNTVGAGDGFASGLIAARSRGWDWRRAARFANACGAMVVTRNGCARALPYWDEVERFIESKERAGL